MHYHQTGLPKEQTFEFFNRFVQQHQCYERGSLRKRIDITRKRDPDEKIED
jgi:hypothetical protein